MAEWCGEVPHFDDFGNPIIDEFIDGATKLGPWAIMSPRTFQQVGRGLGMGRGQRYRVNDEMRWVKVEG